MRKLLPRRVLTFLLTLLIPLLTFAHDFEVGGIYFKFTDRNNKTVAVTYRGSYFDLYPNEYNGTVNIPESVTYDGTTYSVTEIGDYAFEGCTGMTSVTIPNSITSIGEAAFYDCAGLTSIEIPESVTHIGSQAFERTGIYNNESNWDNGVLYISNCLLEAKTYISGDYKIKESTRLLAVYAFDCCTGLTSVTIPNSVTSIGEYAFSRCAGLTSVTIPNSVTKISDYAFSNCDGLTSVKFPESLSYIGKYAFYGCKSLKSVSIPKSINEIGTAAFYKCSGLKNFYIWAHYPPEITFNIQESNSIMDYEQMKLCNLYVPTGCKSKYSKDYPWKSFASITEAASGESNDPFKVTYANNVIWYTKISDTTVQVILRREVYSYTVDYYKGSIAIPSKITAYGNDYYVTGIGSSAFAGCKELKSITIPQSIEYIDGDAFRDCIRLTSINLPDTLTSIGESAFYGCTGLTSINIPDDVTKIEEKTFFGCTSLKSIHLADATASIGMRAFSGCTGLTSINIPDRVTHIADNTFQDCTSLKSIEIPDEVVSLGYRAFYGCNSLSSAVIGNSVLEMYATFEDCTNLSSVEIKNPETKIVSAFSGCTSLIKGLKYSSTETEISVKISDCGVKGTTHYFIDKEVFPLGQAITYNLNHNSAIIPRNRIAA